MHKKHYTISTLIHSAIRNYAETYLGSEIIKWNKPTIKSFQSTPLYSTKLLLKAAWLSASSSNTRYWCWLLGDRCSMFQHQHPCGPARLGPLHVTDNLLHPRTRRLSQRYLSQYKMHEITEEVCGSSEIQCHYGAIKEKQKECLMLAL